MKAYITPPKIIGKYYYDVGFFMRLAKAEQRE
jgi:hypothetical protein